MITCWACARAIQENMAKQQMSLKARAIRYLSTREHSRMELGRKLQRYAQEGDDVEGLLDVLQASDLLSAERFSEALVRRRVSRYGNGRILQELQSHGIKDEALSEARTNLKQSEEERAYQLLIKRCGARHLDLELKSKLMRYLQQRGFSSDAVRSAMRRLERGDEDSIDTQ